MLKRPTVTVYYNRNDPSDVIIKITRNYADTLTESKKFVKRKAAVDNYVDGSVHRWFDHKYGKRNDLVNNYLQRQAGYRERLARRVTKIFNTF